MKFLDTNILIYATSRDPADAPRRAIARGIIAQGDFALSVQVLQEFTDVALREKRLGVSPAAIEQMIDSLSAFPLAVTSLALARDALRIAQSYQIRYWDATILAAAQALGCHTLYSEDLSHGQLYDAVRVINPFLSGHSA